MGDIPEVKLTAAMRAVLRVMRDQHGHKLPVGVIARAARLSATTVRTALDVLGRAKLVQHQLLPSSENRPPRLGYWLTGTGVEVAASVTTAAGTAGAAVG
jgi:hypothetical protein